MDVDGTLTDGKIYMGNDGEAIKAFNIKDGYGIHNILIPTGVTPAIITGRTSQIVENRCKELGITELHQGVSDKLEILERILIRMNLSYPDVAYIGDDSNDLDCMKKIRGNGGVVGCPADAIKQIVESVDFVSSKDGGEGAVREFIEWLLD